MFPVFSTLPQMLALVIGAFDGLALIVELFDIIAVRRFHHPFDRLTALCFLVLEQYAIFDSIMIAVGYIIRFNGTAFFLSASCFKKPLAGGTKHITAVPHIIRCTVDSIIQDILFNVVCHHTFHDHFLLGYIVCHADSFIYGIIIQ